MIAAIIQARTGSSRLPAKVLAGIMGKPLLAHVIERVKEAKLVEGIIVATTAKQIDRAIVGIAAENNVSHFTGDENDVLDRYYQAATEFKVEVIVRIAADCPLIDPHIVDGVIRRYLRGDCDYASNTLERTYPDGLDVEVLSYSVLEEAWKEARWASEREHVTPYIWRNPDRFRLASVLNRVNLSHHRWTVDREQDLEFVRQVYSHLYKKGKVFHMEDILDLLKECPALECINQGIPTNEGYSDSLKEDKIVR